MRFAVAKHKQYRGVKPPGFDGPSMTYDWRHPAKTPENSQGVTAAYKVVDLMVGLRHKYSTDAHLVAYVVPGMTYQPRLTKPGLAWFMEQTGVMPTVSVFFADVDNPEHSEWTDELRAEEVERRELDCMKSAGVYYTAHGYRVVQPLDREIPVTEVEAYLETWLQALHSAGVPVDWACKDWTRHYRLPNVVRDGKPYASPVIEWEKMAVTSAPQPTAERLRMKTSPKDEPTARLGPDRQFPWNGLEAFPRTFGSHGSNASFARSRKSPMDDIGCT